MESIPTKKGPIFMPLEKFTLQYNNYGQQTNNETDQTAQGKTHKIETIINKNKLE